jgi:hypothetical protein
MESLLSAIKAGNPERANSRSNWFSMRQRQKQEKSGDINLKNTVTPVPALVQAQVRKRSS